MTPEISGRLKFSSKRSRGSRGWIAWAVSGAGSADVVGQLGDGLQVGGDGVDRYLVRATDWTSLGIALNAAERPPGSRVRVEMDPARV